jgi:hypothetical protein
MKFTRMQVPQDLAVIPLDALVRGSAVLEDEVAGRLMPNRLAAFHSTDGSGVSDAFKIPGACQSNCGYLTKSASLAWVW